MSFWTLDNLCEAAGGRWLRGLSSEVDVFGVSTDSRTIEAGQVFAAIRGERFDGHEYLEQATARGAAVLMIDREDVDPGAGGAVMLVEDTVAAMGRMAKAYRQALGGKVIAITGSAGKTTTKQMVDAVLGVRFRGHAAEKSFNNEIGVPLTLLNAPTDSEYVVVEIGTNAPGEVAELGAMVEPDIAVITMVGRSHLEKLGTVEGVAAEKAALLGCVRARGVSIVNGDSALLEPYVEGMAGVVRFGARAGCDLQLTACETEGGRVRFTVNGCDDYELAMEGAHNATNALAAVGVGQTMGLSVEEIRKGLGGVRGAAMRMSVQEVGGVTVLNGAYNANPESMGAAIDVLKARACEGKRVAVLGDMLEMGDHGLGVHRELGQRLGGSGIDVVVLIGPLMREAGEAMIGGGYAGQLIRAATLDEAVCDRVAAMVGAGDVVLLKGSRGMGLERCGQAIRARIGGG